ncbi:PspA/IM30 family protein [Pontixanthobacter luteolus]|uniref:PspA/IM30 family protein n=1 Tax=Pontixanthobacter luteolus TaxID=295089 RepID=UPI0023022DC5|nr:PspA/IM30 family protein [Pontixanthobacter luteolus]
MQIVIRVRELVSNNVSSMVASASSPAKMLRHLRREIEEADIALHGEISKLERQQGRTEGASAKAQSDAKDWSDKAKIAMDHGREDLARSALLAREDCKINAEQHKADAESLGAKIDEAREALQQLAGKLAETDEKLREVGAATETAPSAKQGAGSDGQNDKRLDRISELERRVALANDQQGGSSPSHTQIEQEIAAMQRETSIDAELEKLRKSAKPAAKKRKAG